MTAPGSTTIIFHERPTTKEAHRLRRMPAFVRYIGIDYSGAETPTASLKGLRVYMANGAVPPAEVPPPPSLGFPVDDLILVDHAKPDCALDQPSPK